MSRVDYCNAVLPDHHTNITDKLQCVLTLQRVSSLVHTSSTTACHTCCMRNCTGSTSQNVFTTNWESHSQCIAVCSTRLRSTWWTAVYQSQTFTADSFKVSISTSPDGTTLPAQHFRSSGAPSLSLVRQNGTRYRTVSVTRRSSATVSDDR